MSGQYRRGGEWGRGGAPPPPQAPPWRLVPPAQRAPARSNQLQSARAAATGGRGGGKGKRGGGGAGERQGGGEGGGGGSGPPPRGSPRPLQLQPRPPRPLALYPPRARRSLGAAARGQRAGCEERRRAWLAGGLVGFCVRERVRVCVRAHARTCVCLCARGYDWFSNTSTKAGCLAGTPCAPCERARASRVTSASQRTERPPALHIFVFLRRRTHRLEDWRVAAGCVRLLAAGIRRRAGAHRRGTAGSWRQKASMVTRGARGARGA